MIQFNERQYRDNIKKTLGFSDIADEDLYNHTLILNSPTGAKNALSLSVGKYIDAEVDIARESYADLAENFDKIEVPEITPVTEVTVIDNKSLFDGEKLKYFDVDIPDEQTGSTRPITVCVYVDKDNPNAFLEAMSQIQQIKSHFTYFGEREASDLNGLETIISYYQFANLVGNIVRQTDRNDVAKNISEKIAMEFEGELELEDIKKQFGF